MARMSFTGCEEFAEKILALGMDAEDVAKQALYDGAGVTADALRQAVDELNVEDFHPLPGAKNAEHYGPLTVLTADDVEDLKAGIGIAKFENKRGSITTAISFTGYSRHKSKQFPRGIPLAVIARSIESGSSARAKQPFIRPMVNRIKDIVQSAMVKAAEKRMNEITGG